MENIPVIPYISPELVAALLEIFAPKPVKNNRPIQEGENTNG
jgi:hypothetical protein